VARGKLAGSEQHIHKPFTQDDLVDAINKYVVQDEVASG